MKRDDRGNELDPFNAGEPVLPSDDASAWHDDDCNLDDESYTAPSKKPTRLGFSKTRLQDQPVTEDEGKDEDDEIDDSDDNEETDWEFSDDDTAQKTRRSNAAQNAAGQTLKHSRNLFAIVITVMVVVSVLAVAGVVLFKIGMSAFYNSAENFTSSIEDHFGDTNTGDATTSIPSSPETSSTSSEGSSETEEKVLHAAMLEHLTSVNPDNEELAQAITEKFNELFEMYFSHTPDEYGLNTSSFTTKALSDAAFEITNVFAFTEDGDVFVTSNAYDAWDAVSEFYEEVYDYCYERDLMSTSAIELTVEEASYLQGVFDDVVSSKLESDERSLMFYATKNGENWVFDEDKLTEQLLYAFGCD